MVMLTNVDESLADARRRIQDEVTVAVTSWSNRSEAARRRLWRTWSIQYPGARRSRHHLNLELHHCQRT